MTNILFATGKWSDAGTVASDDAQINYPATNLLTRSPSETFRAQGTSCKVRFDLGEAKEIGLVSWLYSNATDATTWGISAGTQESDLDLQPESSRPYWSTTLTLPPKLGLMGAYYNEVHGLHWINPRKTYRWWEIAVADPVIIPEAGRSLISYGWQPSRNAAVGLGIQHHHHGVTDRGADGEFYGDTWGLTRSMQLALNVLPEDELYDNVMALDRELGLTKDVLVCLDIENGDRVMDQTIHGTLERFDPIVIPFNNRWTRRIAVHEWKGVASVS